MNLTTRFPRISKNRLNTSLGGSSINWVKESGKYFLHALYGVFAKNILQLMEVIFLSRKAVTTKQDNYMEITDVL